MRKIGMTVVVTVLVLLLLLVIWIWSRPERGTTGQVSTKTVSLRTSLFLSGHGPVAK